jgi:hypothetical protein
MSASEGGYKTPEKETRSVIKQSKAFVRKVSYSYCIRLIDEVSQARVRGLHSYIRQRGQLSYSIKSQLQEEKEARLNKTPEKEGRGNMRLMYVGEKNE